MKIQRFKNQVFNKPVGVVRSQERTAETDTWQTISKISSALSGEFFKKAVEEAKDAGIKRSLSVDVFDENMQITKAPISMGTVGTKAFEQNMLRRYETKMRSLLDNKIGDALRTNPTDADQYNNDASIAVAGLIDKADPSMKGILTDYATAKIAIGANTVMTNTKKIEDEQLVLDTAQQTESMANQAINAFANGDDRTGNQLMQTIEFEYNELVTEGVITGGGANNRMVELRRRVLEQRIGIALNDLSSDEIIMVADSFAKQQLNDLPDTDTMVARDASFNRIKSLLNNNPHILDNPTIKRVINGVKVSQAQYEDSVKDERKARAFISQLSNGQRMEIGKNEMQAYTQFVFNQAGVPLTVNNQGFIQAPTKDQLLLLADSRNPKSTNFYRILAEQKKMPKIMEHKFEALVDGTLDAEEGLAVLEIYQNMANNMSTTGIHRDLTQGMGMKDTVSQKMRALNAMLTFNSTMEGIEKAVAKLNQPQDEVFSFMMSDMNRTLKDKNGGQFISKISTAKKILADELNREIGDYGIVNQVIDETMYLANLIGVEDAVSTMSATVARGWIQSKYAVDMVSGGNLKQTRFAPEAIFQGEALNTFEKKIKELSGINNPVLGENLFVIVDPNSANSNVRYYLASGEGNDLNPILKKNEETGENEMISIELIEFADQMSAEYKKMLEQNLEYAGMIVKQSKNAQDYKFLWSGTSGGFGAGLQLDMMLGK
ncbi:hypothetical protein [uncultured Mediterranean phage uvMED]|nr:hypothetical protein [uncultured Mediterranean phage uvMED]